MANKQNMLEEFEMIGWIQQQAGSSGHLTLGIGDDCSIQRQQGDLDLLTSTDMLIEGIHFQPEWCSMFNLGRKSAAVNISDIAAMGGKPQSLFLSIGRPKKVSDREIKEFITGFLTEAKYYGAALAGGDTCRSPELLTISVTVQGTVPTGDAICRQGASCGDAVYVSGTLGDSALALQMLQQGLQPGSFLAERFHTPTPQISLGRILSQRQFATAMLDISDGLLADLGHILSSSSVGADLELQQLPLSKEFRQALATDASVIDLALAGGEDYELVFTSPLKDLSDQVGRICPVTRIGTITQTPGIRIMQENGTPYRCQYDGFDHFAQ
jgi:thiamine-monophosphate kinase